MKNKEFIDLLTATLDKYTIEKLETTDEFLTKKVELYNGPEIGREETGRILTVKLYLRKENNV